MRGVAECTFVEASKPADATWEGAMKGTECTLVEKSKAADWTVSEGSVGPLNEDSASLRNSRDGAGPLNEDSTSLRKVEWVPCAGTATLEGAMKDVADCALAETSEVARATLEFAMKGIGECMFMETSKPADATLEGAMKGVAECALEQHEASPHSQLQRGRQRGVKQKERVPLQKADRTAKEERSHCRRQIGQLRRGG